MILLQNAELLPQVRRRWNGRSVSYHELRREGVEAAAAGREADAGEEVEVAELRAEVRRQVLLDAQLADCSNSMTTVITVLKLLPFNFCLFSPIPIL